MFKVVIIPTDTQKYYVIMLDSESAIGNVPTSYGLGSMCYAIDTGKVFILNGSEEWIEQV